jgi:hypothetical protein
MIDQGETNELTDPSKVICKDERGLYLTDQSRTLEHDKTSDPHRWAATEVREKILNDEV